MRKPAQYVWLALQSEAPKGSAPGSREELDSGRLVESWSVPERVVFQSFCGIPAHGGDLLTTTQMLRSQSSRPAIFNSKGWKGEAKEHGIDKNSKEHGHMTVTNLKMVSASCEK